jgi:hypothetical protein
VTLRCDVTFKIALLGLTALPILTFAGQQDFVSTYAQYVFLLLVIGTVGALIEQWRHNNTPFEVGSPVRARSKLEFEPAITGIQNKMQLMQRWETT